MKATPAHAARLSKARSMRLTLDGYVRILAMLRTPMTTEQICQATGVHVMTIGRTLRNFHSLGLIHREQWFRPVAHSRMLPYWAIGAAGDVPNPRQEPRSKLMPRAIVLTLATVIEVIQQEVSTLNEIARELGMHHETAARVVACLRKHRLSRIANWEKPSVGVTVARHSYCPTTWMPDKVRPNKESPVTQRKRWRATYLQRKHHLSMIQATAGQAANDERRAA